ncbi:MAG: RNase adapter RapZ [Acidobacteriota bacterium]
MKNSHQLRSLVIITGMSGSGKHTVFKAFEDLGYFCVDNLPTALIPRLTEMAGASGGRIEKLAIVVDVRLGEFVAEFKKLFGELKQYPFKSTIIFVDASDEVLVRRYSETRRVHPLAHDKTLLEGIRAERRKLSTLRALAHMVIDTSSQSVHDLRTLIYDNFKDDYEGDHLNISILSFGFKHGLPYNSDLVFDVRFLPNPNFVPEFQSKTGNDPEVIEFMRDHPETEEILGRIYDLLEYLLPKYAKEGKTYLTIAIGCTGGRHRSVMIAGELKRRLANSERKINLIHRDLHSR